MEITMYHYLFIGMLMFLIGLLGSVLVKNMIKVLISIEIMLLGVNINFVTFASFCDNVKFDGYYSAFLCRSWGCRIGSCALSFLSDVSEKRQ